MKKKYFFLIIILIVSKKSVVSQDTNSFLLTKLSDQITLDGNVDEIAWKLIDPLPLVTHWPYFGNKVQLDVTQIRIAYDKNYLYVSCVCYSVPENVRAQTYKRDTQNMSIDDLGIILDTFNDHENGLWFVVSPSGSRTDGEISNDAQTGFNTFWDSLWEAEAVTTDFGWTAEMRIPFSSLRFESSNGRVEMGLTAYRYSAHDLSMHIFPAIPTDWGTLSFAKPSQTKKIILNDVEESKNIFITPYLLGGFQRIAKLNNEINGDSHNTDSNIEAGLDLKMGLTENTTLDITLNTDFAQVEADDQQINLTRFSLFLPERRQFFLERAAIFDFSFGGTDKLFFSRRIGLNQGQPIRIIGGTRMITRFDGWDMGVLTVQTARDSDILSKNHSVMRIKKQLLNSQSFIGSIITSRLDEKGAYNLNYGIDGIFNIKGDDFLSFNLAQTSDNRQENPTFTHKTARFKLDWERRSFTGLSYNLSYNYSGLMYNPDLGFQLRDNFMSFGDRVSYGFQPDEESPIQRIQVSINGSIYLDNDFLKLETTNFGSSASFEWKRGDLVTAEIQYITEDITQDFSLSDEVLVPTGFYRYPEAQVSYHTPRGKSIRSIFSVAGGGFFDGTRITSSIQPNWDISRVISLDFFYQYNRIEFIDRNQRLNAHIARFRSEFTFNTKMILSSFVQLNSVDDLFIMNIRFRYNPRDGNNFFIVFNETINTNRNKSLPTLPFSDNRSIMLKFDYTF